MISGHWSILLEKYPMLLYFPWTDIPPWWNFCDFFFYRVFVIGAPPLDCMAVEESIPGVAKAIAGWLNLYPRFKWVGHKQCECQYMQLLLVFELPLVPDFLCGVPFSKRSCFRSFVSNPKAEFETQGLGSARNLWRVGGLPLQQLYDFTGSIRLLVCISENRLTHWPVWMSLFAQLAAHVCLFMGWGTVVVASPSLGQRHSMDSWLYTQVHTVTDHMSHFNNNNPSWLSNCEKDPGMKSFLSTSPALLSRHPSLFFPTVCCGRRAWERRAWEQQTLCRARGKLKCRKSTTKIPAQGRIII